MRGNIFWSLIMLAAIILLARPVSAQFTITIPRIPKIQKDKKDPAKDSSKDLSTINTTNNQTVQSDSATKSDSTTQSSSNEQKDKDTQTMVWSFYTDDLEKAQKMVDKFTPGCCIYFVDQVRGEWLLNAVSPKAYQAWLLKETDFADWRKTHPQNNVDQALANLAAAAAKKLPGYKPDPQTFAFHNSVQEKMMESKLSNLSALKIIKTGLTHANWQIETNSLGIPIDRYKWGVIWARNPSDDHPFCHIYHVNITQNYAGGGTYGAVYAKFISDELSGCQ